MGVIVFQFRYEIDYGKVVKDEEGRTDDDFDDDDQKSCKYLHHEFPDYWVACRIFFLPFSLRRACNFIAFPPRLTFFKRDLN